MRLNGVVAHPVKLLPDVAGKIWSDAVDCFVNHTQTYFCIGHGCSIRCPRENRIRSRFARLVFFLVRHDLQIEHLVARRYDEALLTCIHLTVFHISNIEEDVGRKTGQDRHIDDYRLAGCIDVLRRHYGCEFSGYQKICAVRGKDRQDVRCFTRMI